MIASLPMDGPRDGQRWRPGNLARVRAMIRRSLFAVLGPQGERRIHAWYHRLLRLTGRFGLPENETTKGMLRAVAIRSKTIIDVGANVGRYGWYLRRHAAPGANLFSLEPHPDAARLLRQTIGGLAGCTVLELAAADIDGTARLTVPGGSFGEPVSALGWIQGNEDGQAPAGIDVQLRRLDSLIDDGTISIMGPVLMKIDVEGSEARVLRGAASLLRRYRPVLYFECQAASLARQGESPEAVWGELERAGYRAFVQEKGGFVPVAGVRPDVVNYLGIPDLPAWNDDRFDQTTLEVALDAWSARSSGA